MHLIGFEAAEKFISTSSFAISCGPCEAPDRMRIPTLLKIGCLFYTFKGVLTATNTKLPLGVFKHPCGVLEHPCGVL